MAKRHSTILGGVILWFVISYGIVSVCEGAIINVGDIAPDFSLTSVDGSNIRLANYAQKNKIVVLGLFHICDPCRRQAIELQKVYYKFKDRGIEVIGVNSEGDSKRAVSEFLVSIPLEITFPFLLDPKHETEGSYSVRVTPNIYIIDKDGVVRFKSHSVSASRLETELNNLLQ